MHSLLHEKTTSKVAKVGRDRVNAPSPVVIGETHSNPVSGLTCEGAPQNAAGETIAGYNHQSNSLRGRGIVFRPWMQLQDPTGACFTPNKQHVNASGQGPYTPTQFTQPLP